jgi:transcription elongation factor GreA-like protein
MEESKSVVPAEIESLTAQLSQERQLAALQARMDDLKHTEKLSDLLETMLDALTEDKEAFRKAVLKSVEKGEMKQIKELLIALGIAIDKREVLLGYDEQRQQKKSKLKLQVLWKEGGGGVQIEA